MEETTEKNKWYQVLWAALIFFTRLPFWRVYQPPQACYKAVVEFWPLTGWLTGGAMAATLYLVSLVLPWPVAVIAAIIVRLLITGALHEDGLADFLDGFGGGGDRDRILAIMKDSHIGTYGVLGLILYLSLLGAALYSMTPMIAALTVFAADPFSKMVASQLINMLPQAQSGCRIEPDCPGIIADGIDDLADGHQLVFRYRYTCCGDVFPVLAHAAQD